MKNKINKFLSIYNEAKAIWDSGAEWSLIYDMIFCEEIAKKLNRLFDIEYYDPDTSYEEDVNAFMRAVKAKAEELEKILKNIENVGT